MKPKHSFSARLSLNILLITSILFIIAIGAAAISSHLLIAKEATKSAENLRDATISDIEKTLLEVEQSVKSNAWMIGENIGDSTVLYHITTSVTKENANIVGSAIAFIPDFFEGFHWFSPYSYETTDGNIALKNLGSAEFDYYYMEWFTVAVEQGEGTWSEPYLDEGGSGYMMSTFSLPIRDKDGKIYAVFTADVLLDWITQLLADIKPYPNSHVTLVSRKGYYLNAGSDEHLLNATIYSTLDYLTKKDRGIDRLVDSMMCGKKEVMQYSRGGKMSFAVFGPLSNGWVASITCDYQEVLKRTSQMHMVLILIGLLGLLVLFILCYLIIRKLTRPLSKISESALSIAKGNFDTPLPEIKSEDEIRQLHDSFDYMQHSIQSYINDLKASTAANERFESELSIARKIQMAMVPHQFPSMETIDMHAVMVPAKEVGGDLYDYFIKDDKLYFAIGDVSGKGVPASLFMAITRAAFRIVASTGLTPCDIVRKMNKAVSDGNETGMFVTMFVGCLDLKTKELQYCNAGHNPIVIVDPRLNARFLEVKPNLVAGVTMDFTFEQQSCMLEAGSRIILYTDGVTEAERADKEQYGNERLLAWAANTKLYHGAKEACEGLLNVVKDFVKGNEQNDDITIMTIKLKK